jgi:dTDP-4-amino-4,6-dideoxygalactose transaminase
MGDAGAVVTNIDSLAENVRSLRTYGWAEKYEIGLAQGKNSRMDEIQAAFLLDALPNLQVENARRREIAKRYLDEIVSTKVRLNENFGESYVAHLFVVQCAERSQLQQHLVNLEIGSGVHYPIPDHLQKAWQGRYKTTSSLTETEFQSKTILTLPCHPYMSEQDIDRVIRAVNQY